MICRIAEYLIRPGEEGPVLEAIGAFVAEVRANEPATTYDAYLRDDGLSFIHFMAFPDAAAEERHRRAPYTERFVAALYPRCEAPPVLSDLSVVAPAGDAGE